MMSDIENLIIKYLTNSANANDLDRLAVWVQEPNNKKIFKEYVDVHYSVFYSMKNPNTQEVLDELLITIRREKTLVYKLKTNPIYKVAAAVLVVGVLIAASFFNSKTSVIDSRPFANNSLKNQIIEPGSNKAMLTLGDGSQVYLEQGKSFAKQNIKCNGEKIVYKNEDLKEVQYNYLTIPRSGQFKIELSDGTMVWLNSESQLKFPVSFKKGETRKVELVYGEAYFDVSPSSKHGGATFKVFNKSQEIEVLGTEFNVKAYMDESVIYTTLVEGKVTVDSGKEVKYLKPSEQLKLNLKNNVKNITTVDVYNEISWKEGVFSFENKSLKEMMKVLARWYDVDILLNNKDIENEEFIGVLRKNQKLHDILLSVKKIGIIKKFEIYGRQVIIE